MTGVTTTQETARARRGPEAFALHLGEMLLAMGLGMLVLGGAIEGGLALAGASLSDAPESLAAGTMAVTMTVPMVWWMHHRGHPVRHNVEMAASMVVPTAVVIGLSSLGTIAAGGVMALQHGAMIPAMVAVMLLRYEHYSR